MYQIRTVPLPNSRLAKWMAGGFVAVLFACTGDTSYGQGNLRIVTSELPMAIVGVKYSATLSATGGAPPYRWTTVKGSSLPAGLELSNSGVVSGTPKVAGTFNFNVEVSDTRGNNQPRDSRSIRLVIAPAGIPGPPQPEPAPPTPQPTPTPLPAPEPPQPEPTSPPEPTPVPAPQVFTLSTVGVPSMMAAAQSFDVQLAVSAPSPTAISGTLRLAFAPNVAIPADDPLVQFSTGSRTVAFSIPANSAAISPGRISVMTGTTAGVISLSADVQNGPADVRLSSTIVRSGPPQITTLVARRDNGVLQVEVNGYSPDRRVTGIQFVFDIRLAAMVHRIVLERNVESEFTTWYQSAESARFGSSFFFEQTFVVDGDQDLIEGVSVTLSNNQGSSATVGARFP